MFLILLAGCAKQTPDPPPRYAVLRFENLSGDPSLEWVSRAASEVLSRSLAGVMDGPVLRPAALARAAGALGADPAKAPGIYAESGDAQTAGATRVISGYIEKQGSQIHIEAYERDLSSQKTIRSVSAGNESALGAIGAVAKQLSPNAKPLPAGNEQAVRLFATGLENSGTADLEAAVAADPSFGPAWAALVARESAQGDRDKAQQTIARARANHIDEYDRAAIDAENAVLNNDRAGRFQAVLRLSALSPGDAVLKRTAAELGLNAGDFRAAAACLRQSVELQPNDPVAWNLLGYSLAYQGDYAGAVNAMAEYQRLDLAGPNPLDSKGDVEFLFRHYKEAATSYIAANVRMPGFLNYGDLYKAAWAEYDSGDKPEAERMFAQFRQAREKAHDPVAFLYAADWLYRTGRTSDGIAMLREQAANAAESVRPVEYSQLAVWELMAGDRAMAAKDAAAAGVPSSVPVIMARFCALPSASPAEWRARADRMLHGAGAAGARELALGYALILDGKNAQAIPVWQQIVAASEGTDFFVRAVLANLQHEPPKQPILPNPQNYSEFLALAERS